MADHEEDRLRQRLAQAYPTQPVTPTFVERVTDPLAAARRPSRAEAVRAIRTGSSRRSRWIAAGAAVLVAAGVTAIAVLTAPPPTGTTVVAGDLGGPTTEPGAPVTVALPTSEWTSGMIALAALAQSELVIGADGCLHVGGLVMIWPKGVYGVETAPGTIEVYGPDGLPRIRSGEILTVGGGGGTDPAGCTSEGGTPFFIMDEGFVSGDLLPADYGSVPEPPGDATTTSTGG